MQVDMEEEEFKGIALCKYVKWVKTYFFPPMLMGLELDFALLGDIALLGDRGAATSPVAILKKNSSSGIYNFQMKKN